MLLKIPRWTRGVTCRRCHADSPPNKTSWPWHGHSELSLRGPPTNITHTPPINNPTTPLDHPTTNSPHPSHQSYTLPLHPSPHLDSSQPLLLSPVQELLLEDPALGQPGLPQEGQGGVGRGKLAGGQGPS
ncbi:unnamed protein product [Arctogadus glacialis]